MGECEYKVFSRDCSQVFARETKIGNIGHVADKLGRSRLSFESDTEVSDCERIAKAFSSDTDQTLSPRSTIDVCPATGKSHLRIEKLIITVAWHPCLLRGFVWARLLRRRDWRGRARLFEERVSRFRTFALGQIAGGLPIMLSQIGT
jgi:hypothetical protein